MVLKKTKLSTITAAIATITIIATLGIIGTVGQQQQMASAALEIPQLDDLKENVREELIARGGGVPVEAEICLDQIAVAIPPSQGVGFFCLPLDFGSD